MNRIPEEVINDIRNRARIEDVVSHYIDIIRKGSNYVAYCPFHDDHDPSLHISAQKGIWKCFSCPSEEGSAGDVFKFVMKYKHLDYVSAIKTVADLIGYKYDFGSANAPVFEETDMHKALREAVNFTQHELKSVEGLPYKEYLNNRDLNEEILQRYNIGYNPKNDALVRFLNRKGFSDETLIKANLGRMTQNGLRDVFYDRITIPIFDADGHPVGFTARTIDKNVDSKYINTADTPLFNKSTIVFNLHRAKEVIREKKFVILAEGPMDVIAFDRAGMKNAVCSLGTSTTKQQLQLLRKHTSRILLAFDGDDAGQSAILRTGRLCAQEGFKVFVINNNTPEDPDEIIRNYGSTTLRGMVEKPKTWMDFIFDYYRKDADLNNNSSKKEYVLKVLEEIGKLSDALDRDNYLHQLSSLSGLSYAVLSAQSSENAPKADKIDGKMAVQRKPLYSNGLEIAQKTILKQMLLSIKGIALFKSRMEKLPDEQYNRLALKIFNYYSQNDEMDIARFCGSLQGDLVSLLYEIEEDDLMMDKYSQDVLNDAILSLKISELDKEIEDREKRIGALSDGNIQAKLAGELMKLKREKLSMLKSKTGFSGKGN